VEQELKQAVNAIKANDLHIARKILAGIIKKDPQNERAWLYLTLCVDDSQQKRDCLQRVLTINPENEHALRAVARLTDTQTKSTRPATNTKKYVGLFNFIDLIFGIFLKIPFQFHIVFLAFMLIIGAYTYTTLNTDFFGLTSPDLAGLTVMNSYGKITNDQGASWEVTYEKSRDTTFSGTVRHASVNHINKFPFLTHDILITSGDFSDSDLVYTNVTNHHFYWRTLNENYPQGTINLIHVVPEDEEIYQQLLKIRNGDMVTISGREILRIDAYNTDGRNLGWWKDDGCNTTLVKEVVLQP